MNTDAKMKEENIYLFSPSSLDLCPHERAEKCELSVKGRERVEGRREGESEGGGPTHDTVRQEERREVILRGEGRGQKTSSKETSQRRWAVGIDGRSARGRKHEGLAVTVSVRTKGAALYTLTCIYEHQHILHRTFVLPRTRHPWLRGTHSSSPRGEHMCCSRGMQDEGELHLLHT